MLLEFDTAPHYKRRTIPKDFQQELFKMKRKNFPLRKMAILSLFLIAISSQFTHAAIETKEEQDPHRSTDREREAQEIQEIQKLHIDSVSQKLDLSANELSDFLKDEQKRSKDPKNSLATWQDLFSRMSVEKKEMQLKKISRMPAFLGKHLALI